MTLHSRLTLLFLVAVQMTFVSAIGAYWGLQSWRLIADELVLVHTQQRRLGIVLDRLAAGGAGLATDPGVASALAALAEGARTSDESERVAHVVAAVRATAPGDVRRAVRRLGRYYDRELRRVHDRGLGLARVSNWLLAGIVGLVIASFLGFLAAIRAWLVEPVRALERATDVMSTGDLAHRIVVRGDDELARLATAINRMAASLARIQTQLVTAERFALLGELASYVAHNIRNPLASIRATAQGEAIDLPAGDPHRAALGDIVGAADRLDAWVGDLLRSLSPIALERRPGSVTDLVARSVALARPRLAASGIEVATALAPTPPVAFDEAKLEQVLSAVLANAADASPPGGRIEVGLAHDADAVTLRIADQGRGVPPNGRGRLFTPFSTTKASGTGLGLWLSQKIVVAHGGTITLRDGRHGGTTVEIRLPVAEDPACRPS